MLERLAIISKGKIIAAGTPGEIKQRFSTEAYLDLVMKPTIFNQNAGEDNNLNTVQILTKLFAATNLQNQVRIEQINHQPLWVRLYLLPEQATQVTNLFIQGPGRPYLDDFKLALPSLEDVYLQLISDTTQTQANREDLEASQYA